MKRTSLLNIKRIILGISSTTCTGEAVPTLHWSQISDQCSPSRSNLIFRAALWHFWSLILLLSSTYKTFRRDLKKGSTDKELSLHMSYCELFSPMDCLTKAFSFGNFVYLLFLYILMLLLQKHCPFFLSLFSALSYAGLNNLRWS